MSFQSEFQKRNNKPRPVTLAGYPCLVRRASLTAWLTAGLVPQELAEQLLAHLPQAESGGETQEPLDPQEAVAIGRKLQQLKIELCVFTSEGSRFTFSDEPGKVSVFELENLDLFISEALKAIDEQPIQTADGEVSAGALSTFHDNGTGAAQPAGIGIHGQDVPLPPVRAHRNSRRGSGA